MRCGAGLPGCGGAHPVLDCGYDARRTQQPLLAGQAAFEIDGIDEESRTGWSVIVAGKTEEVTGPSDVRRLDALRLEPWSPGPKPGWMRIRAFTVTGRRIVLAADSP